MIKLELKIIKMYKTKKIIFPLLLPFLLGACGDDNQQKNEAFKSQDHLVMGTLFMQESAEYKALCIQAYNLAGLRLKEIMADNPSNPAIVLDLDETVLDNLPFTAWQIKSTSPFHPDDWARWVEQASAKAIPGAVDFLNFADSLGVAIFYISNRDIGQLQATIKNMNLLNLPQVSENNVLLKSKTSIKTQRRNTVIEQGFKIVLYIGDSLGDFDELWDKQSNERRRFVADSLKESFGHSYIVLPNAVYGTWEGALYNYNRQISLPEMMEMRKKTLKAADI